MEVVLGAALGRSPSVVVLEMAAELSSVPVVDITRLGSDPAVAEQLINAAQWPGFFHVIGHGIPVKVISDMRRTTEHLFRETPQDALDEARRDVGNSRGYFDDVRFISRAIYCVACCGNSLEQPLIAATPFL